MLVRFLFIRKLHRCNTIRDTFSTTRRKVGGIFITSNMSGMT
nr:MAG TPA: hypothetical protein [Caudoviricetes sp.]